MMVETMAVKIEVMEVMVGSDAGDGAIGGDGGNGRGEGGS